MDIDKYYEYKNTSFTERIFENSFPLKYRCSICGDGVLKFKAGEFHSSETRDSVRDHAHDDWEPDWISYIFSASLACQNCASTFYVSGTGTVEEQRDEFEENTHYDVYYPKFFVPSIHLFKIPLNTPIKAGHIWTLHICQIIELKLVKIFWLVTLTVMQ